MASSSVLLPLSILLIFFFLLPFCTIADTWTSAQGAGSSLPNSGIDCGGACAIRCSESSRPKLCKRACGACCLRCSCVPPGTSGNRLMCPCYASLTTHNGQPKCP